MPECKLGSPGSLAARAQQGFQNAHRSSDSCHALPCLHSDADVQLQLRSHDPSTPSKELQRALRRPALLTDSGQPRSRVVELNCSGAADSYTSTAVEAMAFAQQGRTLVTVSQWGSNVRVWDLQADPPAGSIIRLGSYDTHRSGGIYDECIVSVAVHPDGRHILLGGLRSLTKRDHRSFLGVVDLEARQWVAGEVSEMRWDAKDHSITSIAVVPGSGGKQLVVANIGQAHVKVWELDMGCGASVGAKPTLVRKQHIQGPDLQVVAAVPGTQSVLVGGQYLKLWSDLESNHPSTTWSNWLDDGIHLMVYEVAVCGQGRLAATLMYQTSEVVVWDLQTGTEVGRFSQNYQLFCIAISVDGRYLVGSGSNSLPGTLHIWDLQKFEYIASVEANERLIRCLAFSPDGQALATADGKGLVRLHKWKELLEEGRHQAPCL